VIRGENITAKNNIINTNDDNSNLCLNNLILSCFLKRIIGIIKKDIIDPNRSIVNKSILLKIFVGLPNNSNIKKTNSWQPLNKRSYRKIRINDNKKRIA